jgi:hypothetical protein
MPKNVFTANISLHPLLSAMLSYELKKKKPLGIVKNSPRSK